MRSTNPVIEGALVAKELRGAREASGLTQVQVSERLNISRDRIIKIESGNVLPTEDEAAEMLRLYDQTDELGMEHLIRRLEAARGRGWDEFADVLSAPYRRYLSWEQRSSFMRQFHVSLMPGLLQTPAYMREIFIRVSEVTGTKARRLTKARVDRQKIFESDPRPRFHFVIDEAVIRRPAGPAIVMREQLEHLVAMNQQPEVTIGILPFEVGLHPGLLGAFNLLEFEEDIFDPILYRESPNTRLDREDPGAYEEHRLLFDELAGMSLQGEAFENKIHEFLQDYR
ncbi:MAG: helix-turn-helix transcriptional regulator [Kineosporiaceae bacterium]